MTVTLTNSHNKCFYIKRKYINIFFVAVSDCLALNEILGRCPSQKRHC